MDKKGLRYLWTFFIIAIVAMFILYKVNDENRLKEIDRLESTIRYYEERIYELQQEVEGWKEEAGL